MSFWHWLFRRSQEERELDEELRFHLAEEARLRIDRGEPRDLALQSARRDFGNITLAREVTRDMWGWSALERAAQDVRFAARMLRKNKAFTAVALAALTLGIGATTAMYSVVYSVLLKPLQFPEPDRIVMVWERQPGTGRNNVVQNHNFVDWRRRNRSFLNIAAWVSVPANLSGEGEPVQVPGLRTTSGLFEILGVTPLLGRTIRPEDDVVGAPAVAVMSNGLWQRRFGGRTDVIGQKVLVDGAPCEIVGVMPPRFAVPSQTADLYTPMKIDLANPGRGRNYRAVARLKPNVSLSAALSDMQDIAAQLAQERPEDNYRWSANVVPLLEQTVGDSRTTLLVLLGAVAFVLLIACANVANLLLMRGSSRRREMTVRVALGAGRGRLLHQLLIESLMLSVTGGLLGFLLAWLGVPAIMSSIPAGFPLPRTGEIAVDYRVLAVTMAISIACGVFFGIFPALQLNRSRVSESLRQGGRTGTSGNRGLRNTLVISEIGLAVLLVVGAGLMLRSFLLLHETDPGFRTERLLTFRMLLLPKSAPRRGAVMQQILERVRALPQVTSASSIHILPMTGGNSGSDYYRTDRPAPAPGAGIGGGFSIISDDYFKTMGIPLLMGREFELRDRLGSPSVAVLNQLAARQIFPGENPIGKRLNVFWNGEPEAEVVGVVADMRHDALGVEPYPTVFLPNAQRPNTFNALVVRTKGDPGAIVAAVKEQVRAVDPNQGAAEIKTMEELAAQSIARPKAQATLMGVFGLVALALACVGIYSVVSYSVEQRTREMGIRLALGAAPLSILRMVLREGLYLAGSGIAAGLLAAAALTRYLSTLLYTVRPTDTGVYATVSAILAAAALAGCYFPARRATRVDPVVVLREE